MYLSQGGCYFWMPLVEEQVNKPPEIVSSFPEPDQMLELNTDPTVAWVVVEDENDPESLDYLWTIENIGPQPWEPLPFYGDDQNIYGSMIRITPDPILHHGRRLRAQVTDGFGATAVAEWDLSVPEEAR